MYNKWTKNELEILKYFYPKLKVKELADKFPGRSKSTIVAKALNLGLPSAKIWQKKEINILKQHFSYASKKALMNRIPTRSWVAIIARGERLGLKRKTNIPTVKVNENYFKFWNARMSYILGFTLADGCIIAGRYKGYSDSLKFGVQFKDIDVLKKIKQELHSEHKISITNNAAHFCISSNVIVNDLKSFGIKYRKSLCEEIPEVPERYLRDFIRGVIDGDGSIYINKISQPSVSLCGGLTTLTFVRNILAQKCKVYSIVARRSTTDIGSLYEIKYRCSSALKILKYLYTNAILYLDRKYVLATYAIKVYSQYSSRRTNDRVQRSLEEVLRNSL